MRLALHETNDYGGPLAGENAFEGIYERFHSFGVMGDIEHVGRRTVGTDNLEATGPVGMRYAVKNRLFRDGIEAVVAQDGARLEHEGGVFQLVRALQGRRDISKGEAIARIVEPEILEIGAQP